LTGKKLKRQASFLSSVFRTLPASGESSKRYSGSRSHALISFRHRGEKQNAPDGAGGPIPVETPGKGMTGYFHVSDIQKSLQALVGAGAQLLQQIKDVGGGGLIASVKDLDGNIIGLLQGRVQGA
jgi:predicted enzyme related to lactoylglutathione lyase